MEGSSRSTDALGELYVGCAVWAYADWVGGFYSRGTKSAEMLDEYTKRLRAVEGNTTFYAVPSAETVERWARVMPEGFRFCPKLPREITHQGALMPELDGTREFLERLEPLTTRLGLVFAQLPDTYGPDMGRDLLEFLAAWPSDRIGLGLELRHRGWFEGQIRSKLTRALATGNITNVILDTTAIFEGPDNPQVHSRNKKPNLPVRDEATSRVCMVRYIGHPTLERNLPHLARWSDRVAGWLREGRDVLFFCHCPIEERSPELARNFQAKLEKLVPEVTPMPWNSMPPPATQLDLF